MDYIDTFTGKRIYPFKPDPDLIDIEDIAHTLSMICRFGGHCLEFYSVAQHSVYVSEVCDPQEALTGLLHDATEAYLGDILTPIKHLAEMSAYKEAEDILYKAIAKKFGLPETLPSRVKVFDKILLSLEKRDIMRGADMRLEQFEGMKIPEITIKPVSPKEARQLFLERYRQLAK